MSDQVETPKILEEISKNTQSTKAAKSKKARGGNGNSGLTLFLVLALLVFSGVAYIAYEQRLSDGRIADIQNQNQTLQSQLAEQEAVIATLQSNFNQLQNAVNEPVSMDDSSVRELEASVSSQIQSLQSNIAELRALQTTTVQSPDFEWKIFEAQYLLEVANQKLRLETDVNAAIAMIESADRALVASGSSRVFSLRQSIAVDLTNLRAVQSFDRQGVYFQLGGLIQEVDDLDLLNSLQTSFSANSQFDASQPQATTGVIDSSLQFLSSVFVWRRWDETPTSMLAPEQGPFIKQNLRLMLEQSQLALLMKDQTLFAQTLNKSIDWITRYALVDSDAGKLLISSLTQMSQLTINPQLPEIENSLDLVGQLTSSER